MASEDLSVFGAIDDERHGVTLPRIFTPPLRPLTKETSNGFAVIAFAEIMLHVHSNRGDDSVKTGLNPEYYELHTGNAAVSGAAFLSLSF